MSTHNPRVCIGAQLRELYDLDEPQQRALLHSADPRERVTAAWALGMRHEDAFSPDVRELLARESVAGVRRHLLVMLAGFGEVDIVAALARHDPDAYVRKTAARFVGELSVNHPDAFAIAEQLLSDEREEIRASLIDGLPTDVPHNVSLALVRARDDESDLVREAIARRDAAKLDLDALRRTATDETNDVIRRGALVALLRHTGAGATLAPFGVADRARAVADLRFAGVKLRFEDVGRLDPGPSFLGALDVASLGSPGRVWLLGFVDEPLRDYWEFVSAAYAGATIDTPQERAAVTRFVARIEETLRVDDTPVEHDGALTEWGKDWSPFESKRRTVLEVLRAALNASP